VDHGGGFQPGVRHLAQVRGRGTVRIHRALAAGVDEHHDRPGSPAALHPHIDAVPREFAGQQVRHRIITHAADEPRGHEPASEHRDVRRAAATRPPDDARVVGRVPGGRLVPHDNVLDQVADRDQNAEAAGIMSVTHFAVPISRANRFRLSAPCGGRVVSRLPTPFR
jgi:hypothetical protein